MRLIKFSWKYNKDDVSKVELEAQFPLLKPLCTDVRRELSNVFFVLWKMLESCLNCQSLGGVHFLVCIKYVSFSSERSFSALRCLNLTCGGAIQGCGNTHLSIHTRIETSNLRGMV